MSERIRHLLRLSLVPGIGPVTGRQLIEAFGSAEALWQAGAKELTACEGVGPALLRALASGDEGRTARVLASCEAHGIRLLGIDDPDYPARLAAVPDAPLILYGIGDLTALNGARMLSVVGARRAGREGQLLTRRWCRGLG